MKFGVSHPILCLFLKTTGGARRIRTDDILLAKQALYQLSYSPDQWCAEEDLNLRPYDYQSYALTN